MIPLLSSATSFWDSTGDLPLLMVIASYSRQATRMPQSTSLSLEPLLGATEDLPPSTRSWADESWADQSERSTPKTVVPNKAFSGRACMPYLRYATIGPPTSATVFHFTKYRHSNQDQGTTAHLYLGHSRKIQSHNYLHTTGYLQGINTLARSP